MEPIRVMLVDTEAIFLEGLSRVLQHHFQTDAVLSGRSIEEILDAEDGNLKPDVVILGKDQSAGSVFDCIKKTQKR